jgi:cytochrome P450
MTTTVVDFGLDRLPDAEFHNTCAALREGQRVAPARVYGRDAVLLTRFDDVHEALRDNASFPGGDYYEMSTEPVLGRTFISMNGHEHDVHRKFATPAFRSRSLARFDEEALVPLAHDIVDRFADRGEADLVTELTSVLPFAAIIRKLGLPQRSEGEMRRCAEATVEAAQTFSLLLEPLLEERREHPGDDLLSALVKSELDGEVLSDTEILSTIRLLFAVGATTVEHAMGNMFSTLLRRPALLERARTDEHLRPGIVHELLRWEGPLGTLPRLARDDVRFAGVDIAAGTLVLFGLASANRDPRQFVDDPDTFEPERPPTDILTFGFGAKLCPGLHLARRELLTALSVVVERLPGLRLENPEGSELCGGVIRHPQALLCAWDR